MQNQLTAPVLGHNLGTIDVNRRSVAIFRHKPADKVVALSVVDLHRR